MFLRQAAGGKNIKAIAISTCHHSPEMEALIASGMGWGGNLEP